MGGVLRPVGANTKCEFKVVQSVTGSQKREAKPGSFSEGKLVTEGRGGHKP